MTARRVNSSILQTLFCLWVIGAQIWYLLQFRALVAFFAAKFFHKS